MGTSTDERRGRREVPLGVLGMLAMVLAVEALTATREATLTTYPALNSRFAAREAGRSAPGCAILCLGDSQVKFGVDPKVIADRLSAGAYNLAIAGSPPPASYFVLKRAIDAGARPSAVVIGHMTLSGELRRQQDSLLGLVGPREALELASAVKDASYFAQLMATQILPSVRARTPIRSAVASCLLGKAGPSRTGFAALPKTWSAQLGAQLHPEEIRFTGRMEPELAATVYSRRWQVYSVYERYVRRLLALAAAHNIAVFWVFAPLAPEAQAHRDALGLDELHTKNVRSILARDPRVVVIDARHGGFSSSDFFDSCHLNGRGARRLSGDIAAILEQARDARSLGTRWITLPDAAGEALSQVGARGESKLVR